jgi:gluconolactonase
MMSRSTSFNVVRSGFALLEAPVFDSTRGLLFTDATRGGVLCLDDAGNLTKVVPHRKGIGGLALHASGGFVVSGRNVAYKASYDAETKVLLPSDDRAVGTNDLVTDAVGRIYVGSFGYHPAKKDSVSRPGALHLIELDGSHRIVADDVQLSNGLGFSPDGLTLYHSDSGAKAVYAYDVLTDGSLQGRRIFATVDQGMPDGLAVAENGDVWVAIVHAGEIRVFRPDGSLAKCLAFPVPMTTSLCFGGQDMCDVFVVSGSEGSGRDDAGTIFQMRTDVAGLKRPLARVALTAKS